MDQLFWQVEFSNQEEEQLQVSALAQFFLLKVLFKSTFRNVSYTGVLQFFTHETIATNILELQNKLWAHPQFYFCSYKVSIGLGQFLISMFKNLQFFFKGVPENLSL